MFLKNGDGSGHHLRHPATAHSDFGVFNLFQDTIRLAAVIFLFGIPSIERFLPSYASAAFR
jgi:hypothetical protein